MRLAPPLLAAVGLIVVLGQAHAQQPVLGVAAIDLQNSFFVRMKEAGDVAAKDYGVTTIWQSAEASLEKEVAIIENYIAQKVDVILIDPLDKNALIPVIEKAKAAGIPVVTMGNKVETDWNYNTLYPDYQNMSMVTRALATAIGGEGEVALLVGSRGNFVSDTREKGFTETLQKEFPNVRLVGVQPTDWNTTKAADAAQTWISANPDLKGIACISDMLCLAAQAATAASGVAVTYAGHDGDAEMVPMLEDGTMVMDVLTGAYRVGYWNIAVGARIAKGEKFSTHDLMMPTYLVTSDETAEKLRQAGLAFDHITPEEGQKEAMNYTAQMGPDQPAQVLAGVKE